MKHLLLLIPFALAACAPSADPVPEAVPFVCAGSYHGRVDAPPQDVRLANKARQLKEGGPLGGGVDGGIYLAGAFGFKVDAACNMTGEFILHGQRSPIRGTVQPSGSFAGGHAGGPFNGQVTGKDITGKVAEGGGREWVYGVMVGEVAP
jgi:hypothetical protein